MSRRIENHEILERGLGELNLLKKYYRYQKKMTLCESRQNLLLTTSILISATVLSYGDITMEITRVDLTIHLQLVRLVQI